MLLIKALFSLVQKILLCLIKFYNTKILTSKNCNFDFNFNFQLNQKTETYANETLI